MEIIFLMKKNLMNVSLMKIDVHLQEKEDVEEVRLNQEKIVLMQLMLLRKK